MEVRLEAGLEVRLEVRLVAGLGVGLEVGLEGLLMLLTSANAIGLRMRSLDNRRPIALRPNL